jgi:hypothetical protein
MVGVIVWLVGCVAASATPIPADPNLRLWVRADAGVQTSGDNVTGWEDQSNANNDLVLNVRPVSSTWLAVTNPTLVANQINGKPALLFDAKTDSLRAPTTVVNTADYAVFAVIKVPAAVANEERVFGSSYGLGATGGQGVEMYVFNQKVQIWRQQGLTSGPSQTSRHTGATSVNDTWVLLELTRSANGTAIWVNNVLDYPTTTPAPVSATTPSVAPASGLNWTIGSNSNYNNDNHPLGLIAEEIVYTYPDVDAFNAAASTRASVADYLYTKYFVIPEPASAVLLTVAALAVTSRRRRA